MHSKLCIISLSTNAFTGGKDMTEFEILSIVFQVMILIVSVITVTSSVICSILSNKKDYPSSQDK